MEWGRSSVAQRKGSPAHPAPFFFRLQSNRDAAPGGVGERCLCRRQQRPPGCRSEQDSLSATQEAFPSLLSPTPLPGPPSQPINPAGASLPPVPALRNAAPPAPPPPRSHAEVTGRIPRVGLPQGGDGGYNPRRWVLLCYTWQWHCLRCPHGMEPDGNALRYPHGTVPITLTLMALPCTVPVALILMALPCFVSMALPALSPWHCPLGSVPDGTACSGLTKSSDPNSTVLFCPLCHCPIVSHLLCPVPREVIGDNTTRPGQADAVPAAAGEVKWLAETLLCNLSQCASLHPRCSINTL